MRPRLNPCAAVVLLLALLSAVNAKAESPASLCNNMTLDLAQIHIDEGDRDFAPVPPLHPGECIVLPGLPAGTYTLHFTEQSGQQAALCHREIYLRAGTAVRITADDGAQCMF